MWTPKVLSIVYRAEDLLTQSARQEDTGAVVVDFVFPVYRRTHVPIDHVSAVQIGAAIIEGIYCALERAALTGALGPDADADWFYRTAMNWILGRTEIRYKSQVQPGTVASLTFELVRATRRSGQLLVTVAFDGFCTGTETWVLDISR